MTGNDCYALEDRVATHFAMMGSLAGLRVTGGLDISAVIDDLLAAAGAAVVVLTKRVDGAGGALESMGIREPTAMTASTATMARLRSNSVTVGSSPPDDAPRALCPRSTC
jgi:hypothetical protein